jgi:hypothetical protein
MQTKRLNNSSVLDVSPPRPTRRDVMTGLVATALSTRFTPGTRVILNQTTSEEKVQIARIIKKLLRENLHGVFEEHNAQKRRSNIARLWAEDGVFIDHNSRYEGHSGIDRAAAGLIDKFPTFAFTERGEPQTFNGVGKLDWGFGPAGDKAVITGIDVLVIKGDKIGALYTFLDPVKK